MAAFLAFSAANTFAQEESAQDSEANQQETSPSTPTPSPSSTSSRRKNDNLEEFGLSKKKIRRRRRARKPSPAENSEDRVEPEVRMEEDGDIIMTDEKKPKQIEVQWYLPEIGETKRKRRTRVIIPGKTEPGARLFVNSKAIVVVSKQRKVGYLPTKKATARRRVVRADKEGLFALELDLPNYDVQLPIGVVPPGGRKVTRRYQLNLSVEKQVVRYTNLKVVSKSPAYTKKIGLWFGTGFNYLRYQQTGKGADLAQDRDVGFASFKGPSYFAKGWVWLSEHWDVSGTAKMSPGNTSSGESLTVKQGAYEWLILASEATYYPESFRYEVFKTYKAQLAFRFGVQHHIVPFINTTDQENEAEIVTNEITMGTFGFKFLIREQSRITYEIFMRYQYPLMVGDTFELDPIFAFDGSVGIVYDYSKNWRAGLFWYGQWHEYGYSAQDPFLESQGSDPSISGNQSLFFSNIEIRGGYEFN